MSMKGGLAAHFHSLTPVFGFPRGFDAIVCFSLILRSVVRTHRGYEQACFILDGLALFTQSVGPF